MQVVTIGSLLESAVACCSSSTFLSSDSACGLNVPPSEHPHGPILANDIAQEIIGRKRNRADVQAIGISSKKSKKVDCPMLTVLPQCLAVVGCLQLWNRNMHSWNGLSVPADCLALTDSTATICCCIHPGPDLRFVGKIVRVKSWSFIPMKVRNKTATGDRYVASLKKHGRTDVTGIRVSSNSDSKTTKRRSIGTATGDLETYNCLGILEIHSLELLEEQLPDVLAIPSLCVKPTSSENGESLLESPPHAKQEGKPGRSILRGLPHSISPPFILPCKVPPDLPSPSRAATSPRRTSERKEHIGEKPTQERTLGFFVELHLCPSYCSSTTQIHPRDKAVKRERQRPRKGREKGQSIGVSGQTVVSNLKVEHGLTSFEEPFVSDDCPSPSRTHGMATRKPTIDNSKEQLKLGNLSTEVKPACSPSYVYFSGSMSAWRPVLSGALGQFMITITGLRRKLILVGIEKEPYIIFVATQSSSVTLDIGIEVLGGKLTSSTETVPIPIPGAVDSSRYLGARCPIKESKSEPTTNDTLDLKGRVVKESQIGILRDSNCTSGHACQKKLGRDPTICMQRHDEHAHACMERASNGGVTDRLISFVGIVTDILFQGTLLELDERVWLLLTHQRHPNVHGLRIGAMLSLKDVHSITIKDSLGKALLLGACLRSHVSVVLFSPLLNQSLMEAHTQSLLLKYIQGLSFTSTLWVLSLIGSFRQKFRNIYSNEKLLGTKKDPGIIQKYVEQALAPNVPLERDIFKEFFFHQQFCRLGEKVPFTSIMQVPPISNFCEHIENLWQNASTPMWLRSNSISGGLSRWPGWRTSMSLSDRSKQSTQLIIISQELHVILLGSLQVCQISGKLQLVDATGVVDVMIPDLSSSEHLSRTYQVSRFTVVVEGLCKASPAIEKEVGALSISWSSLLKEVKAEAKFLKNVTYCVHFFMRDATYLHDLSWCENGLQQKSMPYHWQESSEKQMPEWAKKKSHIDSLRIWLQMQTVNVADVCCSGHGVDLLCEHVGALAHNNHLFKVSCKVVAVRLLVFEWQVTPVVSGATVSEPPFCPGLICSTLNWKFPSSIPLTLACFVVDDGSGPADCWALGDAAVSLLGLVKTASQLNLPIAVLERLCTKLGVDLQSFTALSIPQILCHLVHSKRHIILQNKSASKESTGCSYLIHSEGGKSLDDDEQALLDAVVASACHTSPTVILAGNIPWMEKVCSSECKKPMGQCASLSHRGGHQRYPSFDHSRAQLFAHKVESALFLTDLKIMSEKVSRLMGLESLL